MPSLTNYDKYLLTRPLFATFAREKSGIPIMRKNSIPEETFSSVSLINISNLTKKTAKRNGLITTFVADNVLNRLWNNPLDKVWLFKRCFAMMTPDFSVEPNMDTPTIRNNIYRNRWLGCTWQQYGVLTIPTISWATSETYNLCFSGVEKGSIVAISTLGCKTNTTLFLPGYKVMMRIINPPIVIVFGGVIKGMFGNLVPFDYSENFAADTKYEQLHFFEPKRSLLIKEGN
jgi:hypothetical protein